LSYRKIASGIRISVIIPTLNEERDIGKALNCVIGNKIAKDQMEVLIIDGGSKDKTLQVAISYSDRLQLQIIEAKDSTVYRALNIGLQAAQGEYFVRVDARSSIPNNYIETCVNHLSLDRVQCAGGIQLQVGQTTISESIAYATSSKLGTGGAKFRTSTKSGFVDSVYLGVYKTSLLRGIGGFEDDAEFVSEDAFINSRIIKSGGRIFLDANLKVLYPAKKSFRALFKQYFIYGAGKAFLLNKYGQLTSARQLVPLFFLLGWGILALTCYFSLLPKRYFILAALVYFVMILLGCAGRGRYSEQKKGQLWARVIAVTCIHFAWPVGFFLFLINRSLHKRIVRWL